MITKNTSVSNTVKNTIKTTKSAKKSYKGVKTFFEDWFQSYLDNTIEDTTPLLKTSERALIAKSQQGDMRALNALAVHNIRFIIDKVESYLHNGVPAEDLLQAGYTGFVNAVMNFDLDSNIRLTSFAYQPVINEIRTEIFNNGNLVHIPNMAEFWKIKSKLRSASEAFFQKNGFYTIDEEDLIDIAGISREEWLAYYEKDIATRSCSDWNTSIDDEDDSSLIDKLTFESPYMETPTGVDEDYIFFKETFERIYPTIPLTKRERQILDLTLGRVKGYGICEPKEIQQILGIGAEAVRVHLKSAINKLANNPVLHEFAA